MSVLGKRASLGLLLVMAFAATVRGDVNVYLGFLNTGTPPNAPNPADVPFPFNDSPTNTMMSVWGSQFPHNTGVIMFKNIGASPVTINQGLNVQVENKNFQVWNTPLPPEVDQAYLASINLPPVRSLPFVLEAGRSLVLAETWNFNFRSDNFGLGMDPVISGSINNVPFSIVDTGRILLGREGVGDHTATTPFSKDPVATIRVSDVPEPSTLLLAAVTAVSGLAGWRLKRRSERKARAANDDSSATVSA